jgi:threonine/homoserine/homoserine lactone efflux protein
MSLEVLAAFAITALGLSATPGPVMLFAFYNGVNYGIRTAVFGMFGCNIGSVLLISFIHFSLDQLLRVIPRLLVFIQWVGTAYLLYLAVVLWRSKPRSLEQEAAEFAGRNSGHGTTVDAFRHGFLIAVSNPKGWLYFSVFFPQFIGPGLSYAVQLMVLMAVFIPLDTMVATCYATGGAFAARLLDSRGLTVLNRVSAVIMVIMAGFIAMMRIG